MVKESFTINRPHIAEDFIESLLEECDESDSEITFTLEHLNQCLSGLASKVMVREKQNYER